jgi:hypothetical protein
VIYVHVEVIFLAFSACFGYDSGRVIERECEPDYILRGPMEKFYYEIWLPFVFNKRRILFLAIASYIALC